MLGYRYDNSYLKLSSFDFFFEHFFQISVHSQKYWCCQRFLPSFPSPSPPLLAFFRSTCIIGHQMFAFIEIEKTRLIWHKNILRYYCLWFFVMIVIPIYSDSKKIPKISSNSSSFWHHFYSECLRQIWSKLKIFFAIFKLINPTIQHTIFRALWWGK